MDTPLTVYKLPSCMQCTMTKGALGNASVPYVDAAFKNDQAEAERFRTLGFLRARIVVDGPEIWSGCRTDRLRSAAGARTVAAAKAVMA
jgi:glutaredoxin-like protein NrdH